MREAIYRYRSTFRSLARAYLLLAVVLAATGGVAIASVAGARRTQSSFPNFLRSTNPSNLMMFTAYGGITPTSYSASTEEAIAHLRYVTASADVIGFDPNMQILRPVNPPSARNYPGQAPPAVEGSPDGEFSTMDRLVLLQGRMFDPTRIDEFVTGPRVAGQAGLRVGSTIRIAFFSNAQEQSPNFAGYPTDRPAFDVTLTLVGIIETADQVVQDDDAALGNQSAILTPALTNELLSCCAGYTYTAMQLEGGQEHQSEVAARVRALVPGLSAVPGQQTYGPLVQKAERAIRPEAVAFGVFGAITALAALLITGQLAARVAQRSAGDRAVIRSLGAGPWTTLADGMLGVVLSVVAGSIGAVAVGVVLSPLFPLGPTRPLTGPARFNLDWTVLIGGFALLAVSLGATSAFAVYRGLPHRSETPVLSTRQIGRAVTATGLPPSAVTGIPAAFGVGARGDSSRVRSAMLGSVLAVAVVVSSLIFGSSLRALVSHPRLYGWNWNLALLSGYAGQEDLPAQKTANLLEHDPVVARWTGVSFAGASLDNHRTPVLVMTPGSDVNPPVLTGHSLASSDQVVLGPATLAALHKHIGDTVVMIGRDGRSAVLRIVGTATLPTIGGGAVESLQMGSGAILARSLFSASALNPQQNSVPGPEAVFVILRPGVSESEGKASLDAISQQINAGNVEDPAGGAVSVLRPAEITNYGTIGSTPIVLAAVLAGGAVLALGLALLESVRQRRHEFAVLKTLGFTRGQLALSVSWQSSIAAAVGVIAGLPVGIALGRWLWTLFARTISAVPEPSVPAADMLLVAVLALAFANIVALVPARRAGRSPTAALLRGD